MDIPRNISVQTLQVRKMAINFGGMFDNVDRVVDPDFTLVYEEGLDGLLRSLTVSQFKQQTNNMARSLLTMGCEPGDKVAIYMRNRLEYLVATVALAKARLVHVNVNYRYKAGELAYLLDNSDSRCVIFESEFADTLSAIRAQLSSAAYFVEVTDDNLEQSWSHSFDESVQSGSGEPLDIERSSSDQFFMYTGGTTGMPKGVMWEQGVLWNMIGPNPLTPFSPAPQTLTELNVPPQGGKNKTLTLLPFMHGSGVWSSLASIGYGDPVVVMRSKRFDPALTLATIDKYGIANATIAGDAFAKPLVDELEANPGKYELATLRGLRSSAMLFSSRNKALFLKHCPGLTVIDIVGSSESSASAASIATRESDLSQSRGLPMHLTPAATVFDENWNTVEAKAGNTGFLAVSGAIPIGYYKDEEKTAQTMTVVDGVRYSRPGDWVEFQEDGSVIFLGRGNVSINTGGEKVFPEEIEITLRAHPDVADCLIVGVPDDRFGQAITAVIRLGPNAEQDEEVFKAHVRQELADYKVPKHVLFVPEIFRSAAGKADYKMTTDYAVRTLEEAGKG
jgi:acyl-CoA synthetase (AMP-forming)/AMP-acid ligase II